MTYEFISVSWDGSSPSGKTQIFVVTNNRSGARLGTVKWLGRWRQYTFFPETDCVFSAGCLRDIADYIERLRARSSQRSAQPY